MTVDQPEARKLTCGVDIGARSIGVVVFDGSSVVASFVADSWPRPRENAHRAYEETIAASGLRREDVARTVATGYGRNHFEHADGTASEIICQAAGAAHCFPAARCVIDIGGQDSKGIELGPRGKAVSFSMNDRCAAGTGRFIEMVAQILNVSLGRAGSLALEGEGASKISSMCAVFAETEIIGLLQVGTEPGAILRGVYRSVARRTVSLVGKELPEDLEGEIVFTGGVARNPGVVEALKLETGRTVVVPEGPQITGALGAAIIAASSRRRRSSEQSTRST